MGKRLTLAFLNGCEAAEFVTALGGIYEHSPWVAERIVDARPFASVEALRTALREAVDSATSRDKLRLLRAHPQLAGRAARRGDLTAASLGEQRGAGLTDLDAQQLARVARLNERYEARFGFPFIIAVRAHTRDEIFAEWTQRLDNDPQREKAKALDQVHTIAGIRLGELVDA